MFCWLVGMFVGVCVWCDWVVGLCCCVWLVWVGMKGCDYYVNC